MTSVPIDDGVDGPDGIGVPSWFECV
jgi:hypothetical protein